MSLGPAPAQEDLYNSTRRLAVLTAQVASLTPAAEFVTRDRLRVE